MPRRNNELKFKVLSIVAQAASTPDEIAKSLGSDWESPSRQARLRRFLGRMRMQGHIRRLGYGRYVAAPVAAHRTFGVFADTVEDIAKFLRSQGGSARTKHIMAACGDRDLSDGQRGYDHRRITLALARSPRFNQDFKAGWWSLSAGEREGLPLTGRWASYEFELRWDERGERPGFAKWRDWRNEFFDRVGLAFTESRAGRDLLEVVKDPSIASAVCKMADAVPWVRASAVEELRRDVRAERSTDACEVAGLIEERMDTMLPAYLLAKFETGEEGLHLNAPVELYEACARAYGVCAAALSRARVLNRF